MRAELKSNTWGISGSINPRRAGICQIFTRNRVLIFAPRRVIFSSLRASRMPCREARLRKFWRKNASEVANRAIRLAFTPRIFETERLK